MKIVTILCQKGGVGKTTFTVNLGKILSNRGFKTLIIDTDPQGNVSTYLNFNKDEENIINSTDILEKNYKKRSQKSKNNYMWIAIFSWSCTQTSRIRNKMNESDTLTDSQT